MLTVVLQETGGYYSFKNIRYAEPPVGERRFKASTKVVTHARGINDGSFGFKCPQAYPEWALQDQANAAGISTQEMMQLILADPTTNEDCLFLDVSVSRNVFNRAAHYQDQHPDDANAGKHLGKQSKIPKVLLN